MNRYDFIIDTFQDDLLDIDNAITSRISFISNNSINWSEIIDEDNKNLLYGVLKVNGGNVFTPVNSSGEPISGVFSQTQDAYIDFAIKQDKNYPLDKVITILQAYFTSNNNKKYTLSNDYGEDAGATLQIEYSNYQTGGQFKINGETYNVISFWFTFKCIKGCILSSSIVATFKYKLKTASTYTTAALTGITNKTYTLKAVTDSFVRQGSVEQETLINSYIQSLSLSYIRFIGDNLQKALLQHSLYDFKLTFYDGELNLFNDEKVIITDNQLNAPNGGVITHTISLIGGAI